MAIRANLACRFLPYLRSRSQFSTNWHTGRQQLIRAPERIYGLEWIVDWQPGRTWLIGGTASYIQGEYEDANRYIAINSSRIPPLKLTAYVQNETLPGWNNRLQFLYSRNRDRALKDGLDGGPISSYLTGDYISAVKIGSGLLQVKVENLLNNQYFPVLSQYLAGFGSDSSNYAGRGLTLSINYRLNWYLFIGWGFHADEKVGNCEESADRLTLAIRCYSGNNNQVALPLETQVANYKSTPLAKGGTLKALCKFGNRTLKAPELWGLGGV